MTRVRKASPARDLQPPVVTGRQMPPQDDTPIEQAAVVSDTATGDSLPDLPLDAYASDADVLEDMEREADEQAAIAADDVPDPDEATVLAADAPMLVQADMFRWIDADGKTRQARRGQVITAPVAVMARGLDSGRLTPA